MPMRRSCRAMPCFSLVIALGVLLLGLPAGGVQYVNDELLWTKQAWNEHKLDFPWQFFAKQRDPALARLLEADDYVRTSLSGPLGDIRAEIEKDSKRGADLQPSRFDVSLLDSTASLDNAAGVAQCKVCMGLASVLWKGLTAWVNAHEAVPSKKRIAEYAEQLCELEVPNHVLGEWVLLRAKVQPNQQAPFFIEGSQEFYMLSRRQKQHATPPEIQAVQLACRKLIKDDTAGAPKSSGIVREASVLLHKYYDHLEQHLGKASRTGVAVEAVDDGPQVESSCVDRHPQCHKWAEKGECEKNPTYMVGGGKFIGQCNKACQDCTPAEQPQPSWNVEDEAAMSSVSSDLLAVLHSKACAGAAPCAGATGSGMEQLLAMAGGGKKGEGDGQGSKGVGGFISGLVPLGGGQEEASAVDPQRMQSSRVIMAREASDPFVIHPDKRRSSVRPGKMPTPVARMLWSDLEDKCLYITMGWWMYEVCYMDSVTQFHVPEDSHDPDWVISLGTYTSSNWVPQNTTDAGLFPPGTQVPYASQLFTGGSKCEPEEEEEGEGADGVEQEPSEEEDSSGSGSGSSSSPSGSRGGSSGHSGSSKGQEEAGAGAAGFERQTEVRLMCSPDTEPRVWVWEPEQCRYVVELYMPQLCHMEGFAVEGHDVRANVLNV